MTLRVNLFVTLHVDQYVKEYITLHVRLTIHRYIIIIIIISNVRLDYKSKTPRSLCLQNECETGDIIILIIIIIILDSAVSHLH